MAYLRCSARKSVIPFQPSHLVERPLRRTVSGQSSHLERLHHRLRENTSRDLIIDDVHISSWNMQVSSQSQIKLCDDFVTITNWS
jgi:hypothetical protein